MNSTVLRIFAVLLAIGAIAMGWIGYKLSTQPPPATQVQAPPPSYPQVVASRAIAAGQLLTVEDVRLASVAQRDPHGFDSIDDVLGKLTTVPVAADAPLLASHFPVLGKVAQALHPGERGVAVKVDEVIGVGGFVAPGDHVDVLLYLRADRETDNTSSAQVVLRDVRVLAFGDETHGLGDAATVPLDDNAKDDKSKPTADGAKKTDAKKGKSSRSAILAVPEKEATRLMLAASSGTLRLALRGAEPPLQLAAGEDAARYLRLGEVARAASPQQVGAPARPTSGMAAPASTAKPKSKPKLAAAVEKRAQVIVHQGDKVEVISVGN